MAEILLWLFIVNLGTAFGAGIYETRIVLPQWFKKTPNGQYTVNHQAMAETDTGRKFWGMVTTMPLTLLTIANLIMAWQSNAPQHNWWLLAGLIVLVERLSTFAFFIPTAIKLSKGGLDTDKTSSSVTWWLRLNYLRNLLTLMGWLMALYVLSLPK